MKTLFYLFLLLCPMALLSENRQSNIDSLQVVLKTCKQDTHKVNVLIQLSSELYEQDAYTEALRYAMEAQKASMVLSYQSGLAEAYRRIGAIYTELGDFSSSVQNLLKALHICESLKNLRGQFMVNNNLGTSFFFQRDYKKALDYYLKSYSYKQDDAVTCGNIGMAYNNMGHHGMALTFYQRALNYYEASNNQNGIALMYNNIGDLYENGSDYKNALAYYFKALKLKQALQDNEGICDALGSIGDSYLKQNLLKEALRFELQSLSIAKKIGYLSSIMESEGKISDIYLRLHNPSASLRHYKQFAISERSMFNEESTKRTVSAEKDFEFQKKEDHMKMEQTQKNAIQAEQLKSQKFQKDIFIFGFVLVVLFLLIAFRGYKKIQAKNIIIEEQKKLVEHKNKEVLDNINYAKNIQLAILPSHEYIKSNLPNNFLLFKPKDIVSGDFYWTYRDDNAVYFATADSTGHGVSSSLLHMIGASLLNQIVIERKITSPELILNSLRHDMITSLNKQGALEERKDGMDISFFRISGMKLECACANNPIYIIRNGEVIEIKADRFPVGRYVNELPFTIKTFDLQKDDIVYTLSDGFCDQFGGDKGKKLMTKRFKEWAIELSTLTMDEIKNELERRFNNWMGETEQTDDVTIFAIRI